MSSWSFIININNSKFIPLIKKSIRKQNISEYEILFITKKDFTCNEKDVKIIYSDSTFTKNDSVKHAKYDNLCFLNDYMILSDNWYEEFEKFGNDWNISSTKIINIYRSEIKINYNFKRIFYNENPFIVEDDDKIKQYNKIKINKNSFINCLQ